jgi:tRNA (cmo5U34)-methyltransferase
MAESEDPVEIFRAHAGEYDGLRRRLVPSFDPLYQAAVRLLEDPRRVLDLGAGTGLLSRFVIDAHPEARIVLVDGAREMLALAGGALGESVESIHVQDLTDPLPEGPFDAVVSAFAIHHLHDPAKADLYARILGVLERGAIFVNAEQVAGPTPALDALYLRWHEEDSRALGTTSEEWAQARHRMRLDRSAPVETQLEWLRRAGFANVDCPWRTGRFAVLSGRRP